MTNGHPMALTWAGSNAQTTSVLSWIDMNPKLKYQVLLKLDKDFLKRLDAYCKEAYPDKCCRPCARAKAIEELCDKVINDSKSV